MPDPTDEREQPGNVVDPETGLPRVLSRKCNTCIYRSGNRMHLRPGRREDMAAEAVARNAWIVCHDTLTYGQHALPEGEQAICRGFWDMHRTDTMGCRLAQALGGPVFVDPPETT